MEAIIFPPLNFPVVVDLMLLMVDPLTPLPSLPLTLTLTLPLPLTLTLPLLNPLSATPKVRPDFFLFSLMIFWL